MKNKYTLSGLLFSDFENTVDGKKTFLHTIKNQNGIEIAVTNYGAKIVSLLVLDKKGDPVDVVAGHSSITEYLNSEEPYFGAVCGRYSNRIAKGRFTLDGIVYDKLAINNAPNSLHGGIKGFNAVVWDMKQINNQTLELKYISEDGEEGFPGKLNVQVNYHISDENEFIIIYKAVTDKPTVLNLTNHSYFNLSGAGDEYVGDHILRINADIYLPTDETNIPYGDPAKTEGTPMDFRKEHTIGERINEDFEQLKFGKGYDHTFILNDDGSGSDLYYCAYAVSPKTGVVMEVFTTEPGVQLYTGNWMTGNFTGKNGQRYPKRSAFCLETQHFPDSPNRPEYPSTVLRQGEEFQSITIYKFSTEK
ncbi:MAG: galactose mutarotase [Tannerella sp.]|jgi:aldose 1-epimerase|nr:galactose mutarotase [Tannerella sp.]